MADQDETPREAPQQPQDVGAPAGGTPDFPVVGIGASAGGLEALHEFLAGISQDSGAAYIVVQHLDPKHASHLADLLGREAPLPVVEVEDGMELSPGRVYIIPPNTYLAVEGHQLRLSTPTPSHGIRMPVDFLFRSLAAEFGEKAICVILSGTGSDGTLGLRQVRGAGGMAMAQDPETAAYGSMPQNAIATGLVDYILPPREMGHALATYLAQARPRAAREKAGATPTDTIETVLNLLLVRTESDFRGYKRGTIGRRIARRMGINQIDDFAAYVRLLREDEEEPRKLAKDMLIGVTGFFRDPSTFQELKALAIGPLVESKETGDSVRVWVPGCATGEEAYSIAMLVFDELYAQEKACPVQVFASDIDGDALDVARHAIYPGSIEADVSPELLERHFRKQDSSYEIKRQIRDALMFTTQDIISSPPFSRLDLISCRNLLIYLEPQVQDRVIAVFGFALNAGGYLFLGKSDSISAHHGLFEVASKEAKIYRRTSATRAPMVDFPVLPGRRPSYALRDLPLEQPDERISTALLNQQVLLAHFDAAVVIIDIGGRIRHFFGPSQRYLSHPTGEAGLDLFSMVNQKLARRLRGAIYRAQDTARAERIENVATLADDEHRRADITLRPLRVYGATETLFAVILEASPLKASAPPPPQEPRKAEDDDTEGLIARLEADLQTAREELQTTGEEYETANEELRASHEEAMSMNEELQSANEELETSKEELQSVNEELTTVNAQLREKLEELDESNSDLSNVLEATDLATIILDRDLRVRRFTPATTSLLSLIAADIGRPIRHLSHSLEEVDLSEVSAEVLRSLASIEEEVRTTDGAWYIMRVMPYRTIDHRIDGVVLTFNDVTKLKQAERDRATEARVLEIIFEATPGMLAYFDRGLQLVRANSAYVEAVGLSENELTGRHLLEIWPGSEEVARALEACIESGEPHAWPDLTRMRQRHPEWGERHFSATAIPVTSPDGAVMGVVVSITDVTEQVAQGERLLHAEQGRTEVARRVAAETSHRTKNSLAIVAGILEMQARRAADKVSAAAINEAVARIRTLATLQDEMEAGGDTSTDLEAVMQRLLQIERTVLTPQGFNISLRGEPVYLPSQMVSNLAVVANELLTNAVKYGAPSEDGRVEVILSIGHEDERLSLTVWSSGNPVPASFDAHRDGHLGLRLVGGIVEEQYGGAFRIAPDGGGTLASVELDLSTLSFEESHG